MRKSLKLRINPRKYVVPRRVAKRLNAALQQNMPAETELRWLEKLCLITTTHRQHDYEWSLKGRVMALVPRDYRVTCEFDWGRYKVPKHVYVSATPRDDTHPA